MRKTVATLLGHAHVGMALDCLGSLLRHSADPLRLRIHEDGTLTPEDWDRLEAGLGGEIAFVSRAEADERVADRLGGRPVLRELRQRNPLGLKLLDIPMLAEGDDLAYCDADILFLRPFSGLFRFPDAETGAIFMSDRQNAYSVGSWHLLAHRRLPCPAWSTRASSSSGHATSTWTCWSGTSRGRNSASRRSGSSRPPGPCWPGGPAAASGTPGSSGCPNRERRTRGRRWPSTSSAPSGASSRASWSGRGTGPRSPR